MQENTLRGRLQDHIHWVTVSINRSSTTSRVKFSVRGATSSFKMSIRTQVSLVHSAATSPHLSPSPQPQQQAGASPCRPVPTAGADPTLRRRVCRPRIEHTGNQWRRTVARAGQMCSHRWSELYPMAAWRCALTKQILHFIATL